MWRGGVEEKQDVFLYYKNAHPLHDENVITVLRALIMEVNKVGVNYNQLVRKFNAQKPYSPDDYRYKLMHDLQELTKKMLRTLTEVKEGIVGKSWEIY